MPQPKLYEVCILLQSGQWHQVFRRIEGQEVAFFDRQDDAVSAANQAADSPKVVEAVVFELSKRQILTINGKAPRPPEPDQN